MPPTKKLQTSARAEFIQPVPPPPQLQKVVLEMRPEVAQTLRLVCDCIIGAPSGRRGHTDEILHALNEVGVYSAPIDDVDRSSEGYPVIRFKPTVSYC